MPPEPLPFDRKDFFKERKPTASSADSVGLFPSRWRDPNNNNNHHGSSSSYRWGGSGGSSDFRRPFGHGKQGGGSWHMNTEESGSRGGDGKYCRNSSSRDNNNRASVPFNSQKEWKGGHSWETTASPNGNSHPHSDFVNSWDQLHSKEQHDKNNGGVSNTGGQRLEKENSLSSSIDWKPLKWVRSGSMSSRGSGFSHSSSSKSIGVDSMDNKIEAQPGNITPLQSPSGDAAPCVTSRAPAEETNSRKKPRLGWGEGLAKYEKKKVDGPDEIVDKEAGARNGMEDGPGHSERLNINPANLADKSPSLTGYSECASPATPSSVGCSSSPGGDDKMLIKASTVDNDNCNPSISSHPVSQNHSEAVVFNLENLELTQVVNLSSSLSELLNSDDLSAVGTGFVRSTAMDKLQVWKADISKALEVTESEIDSLENELKSLISNVEGPCPCPAASSSLPEECNDKNPEERSRPSPLNVDSSGDGPIEKDGGGLEGRSEAKDLDIDSPGTATSKFVEPLALCKDVADSEAVKQSDCYVNLDTRSDNIVVESSMEGFSDKVLGVVSDCRDGTHLPAGSSLSTHHVDVHTGREDNVYDFILASNRDLAKRASEEFNKLLPSKKLYINTSRIASESLIKERFATRKRFLKFKERVISLKFRAFQYMWKEDLRLLSIRRCSAKSQKKLELSSRTVNSGYQKHRSSIRSRFSSPAGSLSLVPTTEIIDYTNKLLSESQVRVYRDSLKMPALILDKRERLSSRFISDNGLVEDPCAVEKERYVVNPWTPEEKETFLDKFALFGKDFRKIASFIEHKTVADCVEFYYKNHKSDRFQSAKKNSEFAKQGKSYSTNTYLVTSGKRWSRDVNAASLDMLGAASEIAANVDGRMERHRKYTSKFYVGTSSDHKLKQGDGGNLERSNSLVLFGNDRETAAADVLAGICGSISSEALSSCITSSLDPGDVYHQEWRCQKIGGSSKRRPLTPEVSQNIVDEETCSDESCGREMDSADWTDEEKSSFIQAIASYGKDFVMISRYMRTRSRDQCKVFFSKARKCLGLDMIHHEPGSEGTTDVNEGNGSDPEDACMVDSGSVISCDKLSSPCKIEVEDMHLSESKAEHAESDLNVVDNGREPERRSENLVSDVCESGDKLKVVDNDMHLSESKAEHAESDLNVVDNGREPERRSENLVSDVCESGDKLKVDSVGERTAKGALEEAASDGEAIEVAELEEGPRNTDSEHIISEEAIPAGEVIEQPSSGAKLAIDTGDKPAKFSADGIKENEHKLPGGEVFDANASEVGGLNSCPAKDLNAPPSPTARNSPLGLGIDMGNALKSNSAENPCVVAREHDSSFLVSNSFAKDSTVISHRKTNSQDDMSSRLSFRRSNDRLSQRSSSTDGYHRHLPKHSLLDCDEILRGYPVTVSSNKGMNGSLSCNEPQSDSKLDGSLLLEHCLPRECSLQKCNSSDLVPDASLSQEQKQCSSSDLEKPSRSGDVKLFGQILTHPSSQQQQQQQQQQQTEKCGRQENDDKGATKLGKPNGGKLFNLKLDNHGADRTLASLNLDRNNNNYFGGVENNLPLRSYGFWDGNRIQTGFPSLPDSAILLAKYPAAFGSGPASSKMEQQQLHSTVKNSNEQRSLNVVSGFQTRELSSNNRGADYHVYRSREMVQPFTVDKFLFPEMQRRKESEVLSSIQQQGRGMVGINVVGREGGILVSGACTGVSDPVAAIKMHYAKAEQYKNGASIGMEGESWRSNGSDIGR